MKKRIVTVVCIMMIFMLVACGAKEQDNIGNAERTENAEKTENVVANGEVEVLKLESKILNYDSSGNIISGEAHKYDKNGNVIEYISYDYMGIVLFKEETKYDKSGNMIEFIRYNDEVNVSYKEEFKYDEEGKKIQLVRYDGNGNITHKEEPQYNENGQEVKNTIYDNNGFFCVRENKYDENGNVVETIEYGNDGGIYRRYEYFYGEEGLTSKDLYDRNGKRIYYAIYEGGNIVTEITQDENGNIASGYSYKYDRKGNLTEYEKFGKLFKSIYGITYEYDRDGRLVSKIEQDYDSGNKRYVYEYTYDESDKLLREVRREGGQKNVYQYQSNYTYDENGNIKTVSWKSEESGYVTFVDEYEYTYDEKGNMIAQKILREGDVLQLIEYEIIEIRK